MQVDRGVIGWILDDVECHVAEISFIADAKPATETRGAASRYIPGKSDAGRERSVAWVPQAMNRTVGNCGHSSVCYFLKEIRTAATIEVGIQPGMIIVLNSVVLIAQTIIERQARAPLPAILCVSRPIPIAEAACEIWFRQRRIQRTCRSHN